MLISKLQTDLDDTTAGGLSDGAADRDDTTEDSEDDLEREGEATDEDDEESASDDPESEETKSAKTSTKLFVSRPILSLPFRITLSTTSSAGSSSSDLVKIWQNIFTTELERVPQHEKRLHNQGQTSITGILTWAQDKVNPLHGGDGGVLGILESGGGDGEEEGVLGTLGREFWGLIALQVALAALAALPPPPSLLVLVTRTRRILSCDH